MTVVGSEAPGETTPEPTVDPIPETDPAPAPEPTVAPDVTPVAAEVPAAPVAADPAVTFETGLPLDADRTPIWVWSAAGGLAVLGGGLLLGDRRRRAHR